jgi:spermidine synthase
VASGGEPLKKWTLVDSVRTSDGKIVSLHEHDASYSIRVGGAELMSTRQHASEERLAELACAHVKSLRGARVLIGGLGFGFTLKKALALVPSDATVIVAEILAEVIAWNRNRSFPLAADAMADPRVVVLQQDVQEAIRGAGAGFDSIILDVDNGPAALSRDGNHRLYRYEGLRQARAALRPGGCLAIWSAGPDPAFAKLMTRAGFQVSVQRSRARLNAGSWHSLFVGRTGGTP